MAAEALVTPSTAEAARIREMLEEETTALRRLVRLARRQNRYLRRQDAPRLLANAEDWQRSLPLVERAVARRTRLLEELAARWGVAPERLSLRDLSRRVAAADGGSLLAALTAWERAARELARLTGHNAVLSRQGLELVEQEALILHQGLRTGDGCYRQDGRRNHGIEGGALSRQA